MDTNTFYGNAVEDENGCWIYQSAPNKSGYCYVTVDRKSIGAHVYSWMLANDSEVPAGMRVLHTCDVRNCVNPSHLFVGTQSDNMKDASRKGRNGNQKLPAKAIPVIRAFLRISNRDDKQRFVAQQAGVDESTISKIATRKLWDWVE